MNQRLLCMKTSCQSTSCHPRLGLSYLWWPSQQEQCLSSSLLQRCCQKKWEIYLKGCHSSFSYLALERPNLKAIHWVLNFLHIKMHIKSVIQLPDIVCILFSQSESKFDVIENKQWEHHKGKNKECIWKPITQFEESCIFRSEHFPLNNTVCFIKYYTAKLLCKLLHK